MADPVAPPVPGPDPALVPPPNPEPAEIPLDLFRNSFHQLQLELRTQGLVSHVRTCSGESHKGFRAWLKDMDRVGLSINYDNDRMKSLALQTLNGPASEFTTRHIRENPDITWPELRNHLAGRFSDLADTQIAKFQLRQLRQNSQESVQTFSERIRDLSDQIYSPAELQTAVVQAMLRDVFVDGIKDDSIARKLIRESPATLNDAVTLATAEQQTNRTLKLCRPKNEEPMEVDQADSSPKPSHQPNKRRLNQEIDGLNSKVDRALTEMASFAKDVAQQMRQGPRVQHLMNMAVRRDMPSQPSLRNYGNRRPLSNNRPPKQRRWTSDGRPICDTCGKPGHIRRQCRRGRPTTTIPLNYNRPVLEGR